MIQKIKTFWSRLPAPGIVLAGPIIGAVSIFLLLSAPPVLAPLGVVAGLVCVVFGCMFNAINFLEIAEARLRPVRKKLRKKNIKSSVSSTLAARAIVSLESFKSILTPEARSHFSDSISFAEETKDWIIGACQQLSPLEQKKEEMVDSGIVSAYDDAPLSEYSTLLTEIKAASWELAETINSVIELSQEVSLLPSRPSSESAKQERVMLRRTLDEVKDREQMALKSLGHV